MFGKSSGRYIRDTIVSNEMNTDKNYDIAMTNVFISNDGDNDMIVKCYDVNELVFSWTIRSNEVFQEDIHPFNRLVIDNPNSNSYRAYVKG